MRAGSGYLARRGKRELLNCERAFEFVSEHIGAAGPITEGLIRDRRDFYRAIQQVRENGMDMTCWAEYFVSGLASQMREVTRIGEWALRSGPARCRATPLV